MRRSIVSGSSWALDFSKASVLWPIRLGSGSSGRALCNDAPSLTGLILDARGHNYPLTFVAGGWGILATDSLISLTIVPSLWLKNGGLANYQPPEPG